MGVPAATVLRGFVSIAEGQAHYRRAAAESAGDRRPLVAIHASPGSSRMLVPMLERFGRSRPVYAVDTLGNGDSAAPSMPAPTIADLADAHLRAIDKLGLESFDLYGSHTGGNIAVEIAIHAPSRVGRLVLDGMSLYEPQERADLLANYAREIPVDLEGSQLGRVWHFVRDTYLFWPWYKRDAAHARDVGLPSAEALHEKVVEVLKAVSTYHLSYRAALAYDKTGRLPLVKAQTLLACAEDDMLAVYMDKVAALMPGALRATTPGLRTAQDADRTVGIMQEFLDATSG